MENLTDRIQDYIDGVLVGEQLAQFEQQMEVDAELRNMVRLQREVHEIINRRVHADEDQLRESLAQARAGMTNASRRGRRLYVPVAAAACLLVLFGLFFFRGGDSALYELPAMPSEVVRGDAGASDYEDAVRAFNAEQYAEARRILMPLVEAEPTVVQYQYYAALTYIGEENWKAAAEALQPLAEGVSIYADQAKYYLGLAYWKTGQQAQARAVLNTIPDAGALGEKKAALLKKVK